MPTEPARPPPRAGVVAARLVDLGVGGGRRPQAPAAGGGPIGLDDPHQDRPLLAGTDWPPPAPVSPPPAPSTRWVGGDGSPVTVCGRRPLDVNPPVRLPARDPISHAALDSTDRGFARSRRLCSADFRAAGRSCRSPVGRCPADPSCRVALVSDHGARHRAAPLVAGRKSLS